MINDVLKALGGYIDPDMAPLYWGCVLLCVVLFIFHRTNCPCVNEHKQPETTENAAPERLVVVRRCTPAPAADTKPTADMKIGA
jgi:hypothetical protein